MGIRRYIARTARALAVTVLLCLIVPGVHAAFVGVPVTVDGVAVSAQRGAAVGDVVESCGGFRTSRTLAVTSHAVLSESPARPATVLVNGVATPLTAVVCAGDSIRTVQEIDVLEPVVDETRTVDPVPQTIGTGTVPKVVSAGTPTVLVVTLGAVSGESVATQTVSVGAPAVVRMVPPPGSNVVALTFDDGPWPGQTEQVLSVLAGRNVPATFFMLGIRVERAPDLARAVASAGHLIGNHTYWHVNLSRVRPEVAVWEIEGTNQIIQSAAGVRPTWIRAPGGYLGGHAQGYMAQCGMRHALWTVDPQDWHEAATPEQIAWAVISTAHPGAVIVLHDGGGNQANTIAALPMIIDGLRQNGYEFVTLDELAEVRASW